MNADQVLPQFCLAWLCVIWPGLLFGLGFSLGRHGWRGALRGVLTRLKATVPPEQGAFEND